MIAVNVRADVKRASLFFHELHTRDLYAAAANAVNVVIRTVRNETLAEVANVRRVPAGVIRAAVKIVKRASMFDVTAELAAQGRPISLKAYSARQGPGGVTVNVEGRAKILLTAFGPGRSERRRWPFRGKVLGGHVFARITPDRLPIRMLFGPSIPTGFIKAQVRAAQQRVLERDWRPTFAQKIEDRLGVLKAKLGG